MLVVLFDFLKALNALLLTASSGFWRKATGVAVDSAK